MRGWFGKEDKEELVEGLQEALVLLRKERDLQHLQMVKIIAMLVANNGGEVSISKDLVLDVYNNEVSVDHVSDEEGNLTFTLVHETEEECQ